MMSEDNDNDNMNAKVITITYPFTLKVQLNTNYMYKGIIKTFFALKNIAINFICKKLISNLYYPK